ncbi:MAG: hypothetical protein N2588_09930 [Rhodovarius sp.]|nr:hypothetical protein [Rhodovarius sp.]
MTWIALGLLAFLGLYAALAAFARADVAAIKRALPWVAAAFGVGVLLFLLLTGRGAMAVSALVFLGPALWRAWQAWRTRLVFQGAAGPGETAVDTATLEMRLDLGSGEMRGTIRRGRFAGRDLASLSLAELLELLAECRREDAESVPLLEAWLDRIAPDWREQGQGMEEAPLDRAAALALLGLREGATPEEIRAAHRARMREAHPDAGGDPALAARLNAARDLLLRG